MIKTNVIWKLYIQQVFLLQHPKFKQAFFSRSGWFESGLLEQGDLKTRIKMIWDDLKTEIVGIFFWMFVHRTINSYQAHYWFLWWELFRVCYWFVLTYSLLLCSEPTIFHKVLVYPLKKEEKQKLLCHSDDDEMTDSTCDGHPCSTRLVFWLTQLWDQFGAFSCPLL